jgi:anti-sigma regulatory factor (Ser/Thr protein kinase)
MGAATTSELRIPADPQYIVVAKRAAAGFGCVAGFSVEAIDDLVIAVTQACENAIAATVRGASPAIGQVRLVFRLEDQRLEVQVRSLRGRVEEAAVAAPASAEPHAVKARYEPQRSTAWSSGSDAEVADIALRMMGLFVDDCRYRIDQRTGGLRVRLTKYRVS